MPADHYQSGTERAGQEAVGRVLVVKEAGQGGAESWVLPGDSSGADRKPLAEPLVQGPGTRGREHDDVLNVVAQRGDESAGLARRGDIGEASARVGAGDSERVVDEVETAGPDSAAEDGRSLIEGEEADHHRGVEAVVAGAGQTRDIGAIETTARGDAGACRGLPGGIKERLEGVEGQDGTAEGLGGGDGA